MTDISTPTPGDVVDVPTIRQSARDYDTLIAKARAVDGAVYVDTVPARTGNPSGPLHSALRVRGVTDVVAMRRRTTSGVALFFIRRDRRKRGAA